MRLPSFVRNIRRTIIFVAVISIGISASDAQEKMADAAGSVHRVMIGCRAFVAAADKDMFLQGLCGRMVLAFVETDPRICPPRGSTTGQHIRVVVKYVEGRPERFHERFSQLVVEALSKTWPCPD